MKKKNEKRRVFQRATTNNLTLSGNSVWKWSNKTVCNGGKKLSNAADPCGWQTWNRKCISSGRTGQGVHSFPEKVKERLQQGRGNACATVLDIFNWDPNGSHLSVGCWAVSHSAAFVVVQSRRRGRFNNAGIQPTSWYMKEYRLG